MMPGLQYMYSSNSTKGDYQIRIIAKVTPRDRPCCSIGNLSSLRAACYVSAGGIDCVVVYGKSTDAQKKFSEVNIYPSNCIIYGLYKIG